MPYHVAKTQECPASKPWGCIKSGDGKVMGCHPTKAAAEKQMAALYANEPGASMNAVPDDCGCHGQRAALQERASVDNTAWDGPAAMSACASSDTPASCYGSICAGKKSGDPSKQEAWALPHHKHPGSPPNAAGVRNALARLSQTQGLTNSSAARAHLEAHMKAISPDSGSNAQRPAEARAAALTSRSAQTIAAGRSKQFDAQFRQQQPVSRNGKQMYRLDGYASVTGIPYDMWDDFGPYTESMHPDAFNETLAANPDVQFLVNHRGLIMARTKPRPGDQPTLILDADQRGLHSVAYLNPDRTDVRDLLSAVDDGLVTEMSFAFMIEDGTWDENFEHYEITRVNLDRGDVSAVNYGANPHTNIAGRSPEVLSDLWRLPDGAQRAAYDRLAARFGHPLEVVQVDAGGRAADIQRFADRLAARSASSPGEGDPVAEAQQGRSVRYWEHLLRL